MTNPKYFKSYRERLGFNSQREAKEFFAAKDIKPSIDYDYIDGLNNRLKDIVNKINNLVVDSIRVENTTEFCNLNILEIFEKIKNNQILHRLNNQGRRPEEVYFSWIRGLVIANFFLNALSVIFEVPISNIRLIGDDDLSNIESFKRTPKADLELKLHNGELIRVEVQSGFQGINDIKQHKVLEAKRVKTTDGIASLVVHIDIYNGQVAFVRLDTIEDDSVNWITRQQMEGQTVFNIDSNHFLWRLTEIPPRFSDLEIQL